MKKLVAFVLCRIYGVRGSLKPPLGGLDRHWTYGIRYFVWKHMNRLYHWSGLPDRWDNWIKGHE